MPISTGLQCVRGQAELCRFAFEGRGLCKDIYLNVMLVCINVFDLSKARLHNQIWQLVILLSLCVLHTTQLGLYDLMQYIAHPNETSTVCDLISCLSTL